MRTAPRAKRDPAFVGDRIQLPTPKTSAKAEAGNKKGPFYRPLPTRFRYGGFDYQQIYREGDVAIYKQTRNGKEDSAAFEVIRIRRHDGFHIGDRFVEPAEVYPNSEAWGSDGFTLTDEDLAFTRRLKTCVRFAKPNSP